MSVADSSVADLLGAARAVGFARLDAQLLLAAVLGRPRAWLAAHPEVGVAPAEAARWRSLCARRADGEPLAYLLGEKEFHGMALEVTPAVLVPRPDTETLVDWALERLPADRQLSVADLGTGSGAVALALARQRPRAAITALDASEAALAVARRNGARHGLVLQWLASDWYAALGERRFDLIVSNPPYIAEGDPHLPALRHEPQQALTSGADGLEAIRRIVAGARAHLAPGAWLLLEHGHEQADAVRGLLDAAGLVGVQTRVDLAGRPRCSGGGAPAR